MNLVENKARVYEEVEQASLQAGRSKQSVHIIAVTKYVDSSITNELIETGVKAIGENRVDRFLEKYQELNHHSLEWHFIGTLQRRKVKDVINYVDYFHALDSVKLAQEIQKRAEHPIRCFLEVNISGEASKHGFSPDEIDSILEQLAPLDKVELVGIMTMAPFEADDEELARIFSEAKRLQLDLASRQLPHMPFTELSMGMSRDFPIAIANGATYVRIGTAFFK
ncbi:YggS family pyridoxal phosphate-dependent enzyme [Streptococcus sp. DD13]|uniref:YggS family pyridoxal phosphate-dependent enzyme n=1 Tax=Streptococcus sp. DD13 TaxID=1777881 RepID=UPI0007994354|nr:YggS family pyridoxal phosphate-dependent enzyme [Streptococcus sp. DD13]KXT79289.1 hypothetical protein STRDD13_00047 [Streptococcus sp. DD13]